MAKRRPPPRFAPPTPITSRRAARKAVERARAEYTERNRARVANLEKATRARQVGSAFDRTHAILEQQTLADWTKERARPKAFWEERWEYKTRSRGVAYEEMIEWATRIDRDKPISSHLASRSFTAMIRVWDPAEGRTRWLTAAGAEDYRTAMDDLVDALYTWAESYGRDVSEAGEFAQVKEIVMLMRIGDPHKRWKSTVRGRAERRENRRRKRRR